MTTQTDKQLDSASADWADARFPKPPRSHVWVAVSDAFVAGAKWQAKQPAPTAVEHDCRAHPGCNYSAAIICNKCGWMGPDSGPRFLDTTPADSSLERIFAAYAKTGLNRTNPYISKAEWDELQAAIEAAKVTRPEQELTK